MVSGMFIAQSAGMIASISFFIQYVPCRADWFEFKEPKKQKVEFAAPVAPEIGNRQCPTKDQTLTIVLGVKVPAASLVELPAKVCKRI